MYVLRMFNFCESRYKWWLPVRYKYSRPIDLQLLRPCIIHTLSKNLKSTVILTSWCKQQKTIIKTVMINTICWMNTWWYLSTVGSFIWTHVHNLAEQPAASQEGQHLARLAAQLTLNNKFNTNPFQASRNYRLAQFSEVVSVYVYVSWNNNCS